jgi:site-specific DNA recombinase
MFQLFLELESCRKVAEALNAEGLVTKKYRTKTGKDFGGKPWKGRAVYDLLTDPKYIGQIVHKDKAYPGEHAAIVKTDQFEKVQARLRANKTYTHKHREFMDLMSLTAPRATVGPRILATRIQSKPTA